LTGRRPGLRSKCSDLDPSSGSQLHDYNGGILPSGLFWTVDLRRTALHFTMTSRRAVLSVKNMPVIDTFQFFGPSDAPALDSYTSVVLDGAGNPVISYCDVGPGDLQLVHRDDGNCAGGGESVVTVDGAANIGQYASVVLDAVGNPVTWGDLSQTAIASGQALSGDWPEPIMKSVAN
jgi:hypothetical protein